MGYPPDFKSKRKPMHEKGVGGFKTYANNVIVEENNSAEGHRSTESQSQGHYFTEEKYKQLVDLLNKSSTSDCKVNMAGIVCMLSNDCLFEWIIDLGASHHITSCKEKLVDINKLGAQKGRKVQVPTGNKSKIIDIGSVIILEGQMIKNVLHVLDFKFNRLSVSKLTKDLICTVKFFPDLFLLQWQGDGIGRETIKLAAAALVKRNYDTKLWHSRLGHPSMKAMQHIPTLKGLADEHTQHECQICPMAKQHRSTFPDNTSKTNCSFELVHLDVWGSL